MQKSMQLTTKQHIADNHVHLKKLCITNPYPHLSQDTTTLNSGFEHQMCIKRKAPWIDVY